MELRPGGGLGARLPFAELWSLRLRHLPGDSGPKGTICAPWPAVQGGRACGAVLWAGYTAVLQSQARWKATVPGRGGFHGCRDFAAAGCSKSAFPLQARRDEDRRSLQACGGSWAAALGVHQSGSTASA